MLTVAASGYFNPLHVGHLEYLELARGLGDRLIVIVNNDRQAVEKIGYEYMSAADRLRIVRALKCVDMACVASDADSTVCRTLELLHLHCVRIHIFAKGGDRDPSNTPEAKTCERLGIQLITGLGEKARHSSTYRNLSRGERG